MFAVDADTLEPVGPRVELSLPISVLVAAADGRTAVAMEGNGARLSILDLVDGRVVAGGHLGGSWAFTGSFSPDGRRIAVGTGLGEIGLLDATTGDLVTPLVPSHTGTIRQVTWAPDGTTFASTGDEGLVHHWDGGTGTLLATIDLGSSEHATGMVFLRDNVTLLLAHANGAVSQWSTDVEHWIAFACTAAGRNLTRAEWREAFDDRRYERTCPGG